MKRRLYVRSAAAGKVLVKTVNGKPLYAHKVSTNLESSLDEWEEIDETVPVVKVKIFPSVCYPHAKIASKNYPPNPNG